MTQVINAINATSDQLKEFWSIEWTEFPSRLIFELNERIERGDLDQQKLLEFFKVDIPTGLTQLQLKNLTQYFVVGVLYHNYEASESWSWAMNKSNLLMAKHPYFSALSVTNNEKLPPPILEVVQPPEIIPAPQPQNVYIPEPDGRVAADNKKERVRALWLANKDRMQMADLVRSISSELGISEPNVRYYISRVFEKGK